MQRFGDMAAPRDDENETPRNPLSPAERLLFASLRGWAGLRAAAGPFRSAWPTPHPSRPRPCRRLGPGLRFTRALSDLIASLRSDKKGSNSKV